MMLPAQRTIDNVQNLPTRGPDPGQRMIFLIGWLKKRGALRKLLYCNRKWEHLGIEIEEEIKRIGLEDYICIYRRSGGEKVVFLKNKPWADQWLKYYNLEIPHHSQLEKIKKIFLDTERKL